MGTQFLGEMGNILRIHGILKYLKSQTKLVNDSKDHLFAILPRMTVQLSQLIPINYYALAWTQPDVRRRGQVGIECVDMFQYQI